MDNNKKRGLPKFSLSKCTQIVYAFKFPITVQCMQFNTSEADQQLMDKFNPIFRSVHEVATVQFSQTQFSIHLFQPFNTEPLHFPTTVTYYTIST